MKDDLAEAMLRVGTLIAVVSTSYYLHKGLEKITDELKGLRRVQLGCHIIQKDVLGGNLPEQYLEINWQCFYLTIDGKPIEQYFQKK